MSSEAGGATGAGGASGGGGGAGSLLQSVEYILQGSGEMMGAIEDERAARFNAKQIGITSRVESLSAKQQANHLRQNMLDEMSAANAMFAARGVGGAGVLRAMSQIQSNERMNQAGIALNDKLRTGQYNVQAAQLRAQGENSKLMGYINGLTHLGMGGVSLFSMIPGAGGLTASPGVKL